MRCEAPVDKVSCFGVNVFGGVEVVVIEFTGVYGNVVSNISDCLDMLVEDPNEVRAIDVGFTLTAVEFIGVDGVV